MSYPILSAHLDDDGRQVILREQRPEGARERRVAAEYASFHRAEDLGREKRRQLKSFDIVKGIREEGSWMRVAWTGESGRHAGRKGMRDNEVESFEGDVDPVLLYLVESKAEIAKPRRCYLDIETDSRVSLAQKEKMRILSWAVVDHETGEERTGVFDDGIGDDDAAEEKLLVDLVRVLEEYEQICVWEGDFKGSEFDSVVVPARARRCGIDFDERRWIWTNQLAVWKKMNAHSAESGDEKESFKLEDIAFAQIGEGKEATPDFVRERFPEQAAKGLGAMTWELYAEGGRFRDLLVRYNARDAQILRKLEQKKGYLTLFQSVCEACGIFAETRSLQPTRQMDSFMLRLGREHDKRFPTKSFRDESEIEEAKETKYRGAFVLHPRTVAGKKDDGAAWTTEDARAWRLKHGLRNGILRNVHVCDFASLYPSIMMTYNLSADAVLGFAKTVEQARERFGEGVIWSPGNGLVTRGDVVGLLPLALATLLRLRKEYADLAASLPPGSPEWQDAMSKSTAFKVIANSFYGAGGSPFSRFYNRDVSEACTQNAVYFLKLTIAEAEARAMRVVYGDSLTPERTVVVKDPEGRVRIIPIGRLWETFRTTGAVRESRGKTFAAAKGWLALTEKGWRPIKAAIQHAVEKNVHMISTKHGQVRVTADHSIMCGGKETTPGDFVAEGMTFDRVDAPREEPERCIDLLDYVGDARFTFVRHGKKFVRKFVGTEDGKWLVLDNGAKGGDAIRIRRFFWEGERARDSLIRLVGAYVSDGSASIEDNGATRSLLSFCKANVEHMRRLASDLGEIFEGGKVFGPYWSDTVFVVRSGTHTMACFFAALCGAGSKSKRLPSFAFALNDRDYGILYESFEDGDGYVDASGALCFTTTSQELAAGVSYVLSQRGRAHAFDYRESKGSWMIRTRKGKERTSRYSIKHRVDVDYEGMVYDLSVEDAHTFVDGIGRVLLHNTDSVFVVGPSEDGYRRFVAWLNAKRFPKEVTEHGCRSNYVKLAFEKTFDRLAFVAAKAYVGRYLQYKGTRALADSEPEIKGLAWKRGDKGKLARELQGRVLDALVGGVKIRGAAGGKVPINADLGIATPTDDVAIYHSLVERAQKKVVDEPLTLDDVRFSKALSKSLREYGTDAAEPHVRVAQILKEREVVVGKGSRIEYVVVDASATPQMVIPATDFAGDCDRFWLWERVYSPTLALLEAAFPDDDWSRFEVARPPKAREKKTNENQLGLAIDLPKPKPPKGGAKKLDDDDELAAPVYRSDALVVRIPESAGKDAPERVAEVFKAHPGARRVRVVLVSNGGSEAVLPTVGYVTPGEAFKKAVAEALRPPPSAPLSPT